MNLQTPTFVKKGIKRFHDQHMVSIQTGKCRAPAAAFTLTELLVVLAILSILATLVGTSLVSAKNKARQTQCLGNLRQQGIALSAFITDNGEYPMAMNMVGKEKYPDHRTTWMGAIFSDQLTQAGVFSAEPKILDCPSASLPKDFPPNMGYADYGYNAWGLGGFIIKPLLGVGGEGPGPLVDDADEIVKAAYAPPVKESGVINPSEMLVLADSFNGWRGTIRDGTHLGRSLDAKEFIDSTRRSNRRHKSKANTVLADGHVTSPTLKFLFQEETDPALRIWNRDNQPHRDRLIR